MASWRDTLPFSANQLAALIAARYPIDKGWLTLREVDPPSVENAKGRRIDVASLGLYASNRAQLHGFEIKVSRSDWLSEIADASKAEPGIRATSHWWLVAPADVAKLHELPDDWGWLVVNSKGTGLRKMSAPAVRKVTTTSWFERRALMRMAFGHPKEIREARTGGYNRGWREATEQHEGGDAKPDLTGEQEHLIRRGKLADEIEKRLGVTLRTLNRTEAEALRLVNEALDGKNGWGGACSRVKNARERLCEATEALEKAERAIIALAPDSPEKPLD